MLKISKMLTSIHGFVNLEASTINIRVRIAEIKARRLVKKLLLCLYKGDIEIGGHFTVRW